MRISRNLEWIRPFLKASNKYIPLKNIVEIKGIKGFPLSRVQPAEGMTYYLSRKKFRIVIYLQYQKRIRPFKSKFCQLKRMPYSKIDILEILAHELAHTGSTFEHTPEHKILECRLKTIFMRLLKRQGYHSEEEELQAA